VDNLHRIFRVAGSAVVVALLMSLTATFASPASAADTCVKPAPRGDDTIHILGCLTDNRVTPPTPVAGVAITVEDDEGNVVGSAVSDETGIFDIALPGTAIDVLGQTFTVQIDVETLPEGTFLIDPEKVSLKQQINLQKDAYFLFPIGEDNRETTGLFVRAIQLFVGGLVFSLLLAMSALGLSLIFGTTGLTNFAHGELVTFGALVAFGVDSLPGEISLGGANITVILGVALAFVVSAAFGWIQDVGLWGPLRSKGTGVIAMMIVSIGLSFLLRNTYQYLVGGETHNYSQYSSSAPWSLGPVKLTAVELAIIIVATAVLVAASLTLQRTRIGKATRAVADNPALAASSGINVERVIRFVWLSGAGLAGLSGALLGISQGFNYQIGFKILLLIFAAVTLGGLGTIWGAMAGALIIGLFIELSTLWIPAELKYVGALGVLILILLIRPQGLLGRAQRIG
jgi:branched-chain amino acid transport system permease protein